MKENKKKLKKNRKKKAYLSLESRPKYEELSLLEVLVVLLSWLLP